MSKVIVNAGVCGFNSVIDVTSEDGQMAVIDFKTECPNLKPMETELKEVDAYVEVFGKIGDTEIYQMCKKYCKHVSCPLPSAIIKGVEVACNLALPHDVEMKITK